MISVAKILQNASEDDAWGRIAVEALRVIEAAGIDPGSIGDRPEVSSIYLSELYEFRRNAGYISDDARGVNETISSLSQSDFGVFVTGFEAAGTFIIAMCTTEGCLCGLIMLPKLHREML